VTTRHFAGHRDEILQAHDFAYGGGHFGGETGGQGGETGGVRLLREQPVAQFADGQVTDGGESRAIVSVADKARDFVPLVRDGRIGKEGFQRKIGELHLGAHALFGGMGGEAREPVAGSGRRGFRQQRRKAAGHGVGDHLAPV
jgi:hypothetical protein